MRVVWSRTATPPPLLSPRQKNRSITYTQKTNTLMKRMLSILALLGTFLLLPLVAQAQEYTITINQVEHATISAYYIWFIRHFV